MITKTLKRKAMDNYGHEYTVVLRFAETEAGQTRHPETKEWYHAPCNKWVEQELGDMDDLETVMMDELFG